MEWTFAIIARRDCGEGGFRMLCCGDGDDDGEFDGGNLHQFLSSSHLCFQPFLSYMARPFLSTDS